MSNYIYIFINLGAAYDMCVEMWSRNLDFTHYKYFCEVHNITPLSEQIFDHVCILCTFQHNKDRE